MKEQNALAQNYTAASLTKFALPSIVMEVAASIYGIADGAFVSRFVGTDALSAINIVYPYVALYLAMGVMMGSGGSAIVARKLGQGLEKEARKDFTLVICSGVCIAAVLSIFGYLTADMLLALLGANDRLMPYCREYLYYMLLCGVPYMLQILFGTFFVAAGRPALGMRVTIAAGLVDILFNYVFIVMMDQGIRGAALSNLLGCMIPAVVGVMFFTRKATPLYFSRFCWNGNTIFCSCSNGLSEMVGNLAYSVITLLYNITMMRLLGEKGVAAVTVVLYAEYFFSAVYIGYAGGVAPVISFKYGAQDLKQLHKIYYICTRTIVIASIFITVGALCLAPYIVRIFAPVDSAVYEIALKGFRLFSVCYLFSGMNIFASALFTALSNGKVSAVISLMRTFVFVGIGLLVIPRILGVLGVWMAVPLAESAAIIISIGCLRKYRSIYHYR